MNDPSTTQATIATGDRLVIVDSDTTAGNKIAPASITFDTTKTGYALTQAGTWAAFNNYSLPTASASTKGGVKIGTGLTMGGTSTDTLTLNTAYGDSINPYGSKTANYVLAAPNGSNGVPSFRALVAADIPSLTLSKISDATDLAAIEALTGTSGILKKTAANTWTLDTNSYVTSSGVTSVATGVGLTGGTITATGTVKAKLASETLLTNDAATPTEDANRIYAVRADKSGNLAVIVPWSNSTSFTITANATDGLWDLTGTSGSNSVTYALAPYSAKGTDARFYTGTTNPSLTTRLNYDGYFYGTKLYSGGSEVLTSHQSVSNANATLAWGSATKIATIGSTDINVSLPSNPNTDRYVNSAVFADDTTNNANSPVKMTLTRAGSDTQTVTANLPKVSSSSAGVVPKGASVSSQSQSTKFLREDGTWAAPSYTTNTNTHYTARLITASSASGTTQVTAATTSPYINLYEDSTVRDSIRFVGSGTTTVQSSADGKTITISSADSKTGTVTSVTAGTGLNTTADQADSATKGSITSSGALHLTTSGVTAGSYGPSANASPGHGSGFSVPYVTVDKYGRVTAASTKTITLPGNPVATTTSTGIVKIGSGISVDSNGTISVSASNLGLSSALRFAGVTTTALTDGATTSPISIGGTDYTPSIGDVVIYHNTTANSDEEFVWIVESGNNRWEKLGGDNSYKVVQTAITDSTGTSESTTATRFVYSISQDANGVVSVKTRPLPTYNNYSLPTASDSTLGGIKVGTTLEISSGVLNQKSGIVTAGSAGPSGNASPAHGAGFSVPYITVDTYGRVTALSTKTITLPSDNDTKNTAGSTDTSSKIYLIGATTQATNPQTYSDNQVYVTDGQLDANKVRVAEHVILQYNTTTSALDFVFV